jgi:hypothetical protein
VFVVVALAAIAETVVRSSKLKQRKTRVFSTVDVHLSVALLDLLALVNGSFSWQKGRPRRGFLSAQFVQSTDYYG